MTPINTRDALPLDRPGREKTNGLSHREVNPKPGRQKPKTAFSRGARIVGAKGTLFPFSVSLVASIAFNFACHVKYNTDISTTSWVVHPSSWSVGDSQRRENACLSSYKPVQNTSLTHVRSSKVASSVLNQPLPRICGNLRRKWETQTRITLSSMLLQEITEHQTDCSAPVMRFDVDNQYGLGSHLVLWSQALCNAWEQGHRVQTYNPEWLWSDQAHCNRTRETQYNSPLECYFPGAEIQCPQDIAADPLTLQPVPDPRNRKLFCQRLSGKNDSTALREFRSYSFAYLFQKLSPFIVHEAERQLGLLFPTTGRAPEGMIAVHMRWGDKFWEMDLPAVNEYMDGIRQILAERTNHMGADHAVHIYLATEDPRAAQAFREAVRNQTAIRPWNVHVDRTVSELNDYRPPKGNRASWTTRNTRGRAGLVALGSLLVTLEASDFVLTTQSNWSRLVHALLRHRLSDLKAKILDLRPGDW